jgi:hypothetical protein
MWRHVTVLNFFATVGIEHRDGQGMTSELGIGQADKLFHSIDARRLVGLRDRAVISTPARPPTSTWAQAALGPPAEHLRVPDCCAALSLTIPPLRGSIAVLKLIPATKCVDRPL